MIFLRCRIRGVSFGPKQPSGLPTLAPFLGKYCEILQYSGGAVHWLNADAAYAGGSQALPPTVAVGSERSGILRRLGHQASVNSNSTVMPSSPKARLTSGTRLKLPTSRWTRALTLVAMSTVECRFLHKPSRLKQVIDGASFLTRRLYRSEKTGRAL